MRGSDTPTPGEAVEVSGKSRGKWCATGAPGCIRARMSATRGSVARPRVSTPGSAGTLARAGRVRPLSAYAIERATGAPGVITPVRECDGSVTPVRLTASRKHREYTHTRGSGIYTRKRYTYTGEAVEVSGKRRGKWCAGRIGDIVGAPGARQQTPPPRVNHEAGEVSPGERPR